MHRSFCLHNNAMRWVQCHFTDKQTEALGGTSPKVTWLANARAWLDGEDSKHLWCIHAVCCVSII